MPLSSQILTQSRLKHLATTYPTLSQNSLWATLTASTLTTCNQPNEIPLLYHYSITHSQHVNNGKSIDYDSIYEASLRRVEEFERANASDNDSPVLTTLTNPFISPSNFDHQFKQTQLIREALIKSIALIGLPKVINSLMILKTHTPHPLRSQLTSRDFTLTAEQNKAKGKKYWDTVYKGKLSPRIQSQLNTAAPDLWEYTIQHTYGALLSHSAILSPRETSLLILCCLIPQDVNPQLKGHLRGAVNNGCDVKEIEEARGLSMMVSEWCGVSWSGDVAKLKL